ncbi:MAG: SDR family NAD(P)-dependent oxidoreductase [Arenicellales bacterium]|nr:SDR family NAD(P)-dependent oxidoreductase [Arenicellales bacterium]
MDQGRSMMDRWRGRVAVVTGASSGIGRAVALDLLKAGMRVAVCARRLELIENLGFEAGVPDAFMAKAADLRVESEIGGFFDAVKSHWQGVHVLVNNAGLGFEGELSTQNPGEWRQMLDVNVLALGICTQQALSQMGGHGEEGQVINIGSMSGQRVPAGSNGMYCATKFAVRALTESFRQELHAANRPVRICEISPGLVETGFAAHYGGSEDAAEKTYGAFKCLQSEDIVDAVRYVLGQPTHVQVHDVLIRPTGQAS